MANRKWGTPPSAGRSFAWFFHYEKQRRLDGAGPMGDGASRLNLRTARREGVMSFPRRAKAEGMRGTFQARERLF